MIVASSNLFLRSEHAAEERREERETLRAWTGASRPDFEGTQASSAGRPESAQTPDVVMRISEAARALAAAIPPPSSSPSTPPSAPPASAEAQAIEDAGDAVENDPTLRLIKSMIEMLTGHRVRIFSARDFSRDIEVRTEAVSSATSAAAAAASASTTANPNRPAGWGIEYDYHAVSEETETTHLSAAGVIRTTDGQEISFKLDLMMQRYHREETHVSIRAGDAVRKDPLVLNFGGTAAQLSNQRFLFDLFNTGDTGDNGGGEALPLFASASGYLALDIDGNGRIESGKELFGPATNSGFGELASHDDDGNGWIDEADAIFKRLAVWAPAVDGEGKLYLLKELGVGAISLGHVATPFELRGSGNTDLGAVRASGVWLSDSGKVGSIQEIDLTV